MALTGAMNASRYNRQVKRIEAQMSEVYERLGELDGMLREENRAGNRLTRLDGIVADGRGIRLPDRSSIIRRKAA